MTKRELAMTIIEGLQIACSVALPSNLVLLAWFVRKRNSWPLKGRMPLLVAGQALWSLVFCCCFIAYQSLPCFWLFIALVRQPLHFVFTILLRRASQRT